MAPTPDPGGKLPVIDPNGVVPEIPKDGKGFADLIASVVDVMPPIVWQVSAVLIALAIGKVIFNKLPFKPIAIVAVALLIIIYISK